MNKRDWFFDELVTEQSMDQSFLDVEEAIRARNIDIDLRGICKGLDVTSNGNPLEVQVGTGAAYDSLGRRIFIDSAQTIDLTVSSAGVPLSLPPVGEEYYIVISVGYTQALSVPVTDGAGVEVFTRIEDSFELFVRQNATAPAGTATYALPAEPEVVLAVVLINSGTAVVPPGQIVTTDRKEMFTASFGGTTVQGRNFTEVGEEIVELIDTTNTTTSTDIFNTFSGNAGSTLVGHSPLARWAEDLAKDPAIRRDLTPTTVYQNFANIVSDLASSDVLSPTARPGADRVGFRSDTLYLDGESMTVSTVDHTVRGALERMVVKLGLQSSIFSGAAIVGYHNAGLWFDGTGLNGAPGSVDEAIKAIQADLAGVNGSDKIQTRAFGGRPIESVRDRIEAIGTTATASTVFTGTDTWFDGSSLSGAPADLNSAINAVVNDLGLATGATKIGTSAHSGPNLINRPNEALQDRLEALQDAITPTNAPNQWGSRQQFLSGASFGPQVGGVNTFKKTVNGTFGSGQVGWLAFSTAVSNAFQFELSAAADGTLGLAGTITVSKMTSTGVMETHVMSVLARGTKTGASIVWAGAGASGLMTFRVGDSDPGVLADTNFYGLDMDVAGTVLQDQGQYNMVIAGGPGTDCTGFIYAAGDLILNTGTINLLGSGSVTFTVELSLL